MAGWTSPGPVWCSGGARGGGVEGETSPPSRIPAVDSDPSLLRVPDDACGRGCPYGAARPGAEVFGFVRYSAMCQAPPDRGRFVSQAGTSEVRRGAPVEYPGDRGEAERTANHSGGVGRLRRPVRGSGICARIYGGRRGSGDSQDERTPAGEGGGGGLRL